MMKFLPATFLLFLLILPLTQATKKYDDDITPGKVNLHDIEDSHIRTQKKIKLAAQKSTRKPQNSPIKSSIVNPLAAVAENQNTVPGVQPLHRFVFSPFVTERPSYYDSSEANHHLIEAVRPQQQQQQVFSYNHDESPSSPDYYSSNNNNRQQLQQQQQQQRQHESHMTTSASPQPPVVVTFSHSAMPSNAFHQPLPHAQYLHHPPGVQYLTSNDIHSSSLYNSGDDGGKGDGIQFVEYSREDENGSGKQMPIEYGDPDVIFRRLQQKGQSNQQAYAPKRPTTENSDYHMVPFPPSFISITTERPTVLVQPTRSPDGENIVNWHQTNVVPLEPMGPMTRQHHTNSPPVFDIFAGRQAKSLLDSYIPSWVVTKMQDLRIRLPFYLYNQIGFDGYEHSGNFKRSPADSVKRKSFPTDASNDEIMMTS